MPPELGDEQRSFPAPLTSDAIALSSLHESITSLGYLKPNTASKMLGLLKELPYQTARHVATAYRKSGEQLSADEKRGLGIRTNSFMSKDAFEELTEKGLSAPLLAHEVTLLRAHFTMHRLNSYNNIVKAGIREVRHDCPFNESEGCKRLHRKIVRTEDAQLEVPTDCKREACALTVFPEVDYTENLR